MDANDLFLGLKKQGCDLTHLPLILMTGTDEWAEQRGGEQQDVWGDIRRNHARIGFQGVHIMQKPVAPRDLIAQVEKRIGKRE